MNGRAKYLRDAGYEVHYLGFEDQHRIGTIYARIQIHYIPAKMYKSRILNVLYHMLTVWVCVRRHDFDVVHIMTIEYGMFAPLCRKRTLIIENTGSDVLVTRKKSRLVASAYRLFL